LQAEFGFQLRPPAVYLIIALIGAAIGLARLRGKPVNASMTKPRTTGRDPESDTGGGGVALETLGGAASIVYDQDGADSSDETDGLIGEGATATSDGANGSSSRSSDSRPLRRALCPLGVVGPCLVLFFARASRRRLRGSATDWVLCVQNGRMRSCNAVPRIGESVQLQSVSG
jgi:hypothetical protein